MRSVAQFTIALVTFASGTAVPAMSAEMIKGCFERVYDKGHMAKHNGQVARAMQLQIGISAAMPAGQAGEDDEDRLAIRSEGKNELFFSGTLCRGNADEASCQNASNAERFSVVKTRNGVKLTFETPITFLIEGTFDSTIILPRDAENQVYALVKVSENNCGLFKK